MSLHPGPLLIHAVESTWKAIPGYPGYEVSDLGYVRSVQRTVVDKRGRKRTFPGKQLATQNMNNRGYRYAGLWVAGKLTYVKACRLVLLAFQGLPPFEGAMVLHHNDVKDDDRLLNLRWGTGSENSQDAIRNGVHPEASKTECVNGHEFTERNTYMRPDGKGRGCRQCMLDRNRKTRGVTADRFRKGELVHVD